MNSDAHLYGPAEYGDPGCFASGPARCLVPNSAAHRNVGPEGRRFIEAQVGELDKALLASLQGANPRP
jgi:hypothetical protein